MAKQRSSGSPPPGQVNIIGQGTVIEGGLKAKSDVRISGKVIGNVDIEGKAVVTPEGEVEGEIRSTHADIAGHVDGEVFIQERLVLKASAIVKGDIHTAKLVIEDGATFTGTCDMGGTVPKPGSKSNREQASTQQPGKPESGRPAPAAEDQSDKRADMSSGDRSNRPAAPPRP